MQAAQPMGSATGQRGSHVKRSSHATFALAAAATLALGASRAAMAAYTSTTTFQETNATGTQFATDDPLNWSNGLPDATKLAIFPDLGQTTTGNSAPSSSPITAYGIRYDNTVGDARFTGDVWTLTSTDSVADTTAMTAPAIHYSATALGEFQFYNPIQLGDGSVASGTATVLTEAGRTILGGYIRQAPGTSWGMTIMGAGRTQFRANNGGGSYLVNRYDFSGQLTIDTDPGGYLLVQNNVLPYGAGLPNIMFQTDGRMEQALNGNTLIMNSLDSVDSVATFSRNRGNDIAIGANGLDGNFAGVFNNTSTRIYKVGTGNQVLTNDSNAFGRLQLINGTVTATSMSDNGSVSASGSGSIIFDGGALKYTGAGNTSTNRDITVSFRGGTIDASGTGALVINSSGTITSGDTATAFGDNDAVGGSTLVTNMYGINGLSGLVAAGSLQISAVGVGINNAVGTVPVSIDETARTMQLAAGATNDLPGNGQGAPRVELTATSGIARTLTLTGTNADANTLSGAMADSAMGGTLNISKSGPGTWVLSGDNNYTGTTTVQAGKLVLSRDDTTDPLVPTNAWRPVLDNAGGADVQGGRLAFDYSKYSGGSPASTVQGILTTGFGQATKFSSGAIHTTSSTASDKGLGWKDDTAAQQVVVGYTYYGDANLDGQVDVTDLGALATNWQTSNVWAGGDFNYDGFVDVTDLGALATNWQKGVGNPLGAGSLQAALESVGLGNVSVPEPASLGAIGICLAAAASRRRTRRGRRG